MAKPLRVQLLDAYHVRLKEDGLSFEELSRLCGLGLTGDSISRKLRGKQVLYDNDVEALAKALRVEVVTGKPRKAAA